VILELIVPRLLGIASVDPLYLLHTTDRPNHFQADFLGADKNKEPFARRAFRNEAEQRT
jgi:hypothetical protein